MLTLKEISLKSGVGVHSLRKLVKTGFLKAMDEDPQATAIRNMLAKQRPLSVSHLVAIMTEPALVEMLGRYGAEAQAQVARLGRVYDSAAPREISALIDDAANNRADAVAALGGWLRVSIPEHDVSHAWLAIRLIWNSPENLRAEDIKRVPLALINVRPEIPGYWRVDKLDGRTQTIYRCPKFIDL